MKIVKGETMTLFEEVGNQKNCAESNMYLLVFTCKPLSDADNDFIHIFLHVLKKLGVSDHDRVRISLLIVTPILHIETHYCKNINRVYKV